MRPVQFVLRDVEQRLVVVGPHHAARRVLIMHTTQHSAAAQAQLPLRQPLPSEVRPLDMHAETRALLAVPAGAVLLRLKAPI